jgi:pyruvate formate lyase activating enzyme
MNEMNEITGKIHSIETCGTVDGPGIRYVLFMQGCALRCMYCHNPDTWNPNSKSRIIKTVDEVMTDILKYKSYFKFSGGGVTLTGGEPLLQKEFAAALFKACKEEGLHTTIDTSGCIYLDEQTDEVLKYTDLVLLDIKSINHRTFRKVTGAPVDVVKLFANDLREKGIKTWVRFVLVPGLTDNEQELHEIAEFLKKFDNIERIGVLPFHQMGAFKWQNLRLNYKLGDTPEPTEEEIAKVQELFKSYGLDVKIN